MEKNGCMILSGKFFMINTINSLKIFDQCGSGDGERNLIIFFSSEIK
jgi:hypothetical protein